ncbi:MAG TPA: hypothetical protein VN420_01250 [Candidatus Fimivivens sp.]|nr:hypothetical protein [Candidatus Fimivivens sp.]
MYERFIPEVPTRKNGFREIREGRAGGDVREPDHETALEKIRKSSPKLKGTFHALSVVAALRGTPDAAAVERNDPAPTEASPTVAGTHSSVEGTIEETGSRLVTDERRSHRLSAGLPLDVDPEAVLARLGKESGSIPTGIDVGKYLDALERKSGPREAVRFLGSFDGDPRAEERVRRAAQADPVFVGTHLSKYLTEKAVPSDRPEWVKDILTRSLEAQILTDPMSFSGLIQSEGIGREPLVAEMSMRLATEYPDLIISIIRNPDALPWMKDALYVALQAGASSVPGKSLSAIRRGLTKDLPHERKQVIFDKAVHSDPYWVATNGTREKSPELADLLESSSDPVARELRELGSDSRGADPRVSVFIDPLSKGTMTTAQVSEVLADRRKLTDGLLSVLSDRTAVGRHSAKRLAVETYDKTVGTINELHDLPDQTRFKTLEGMSANELYLLIVSGNGDLYTSSFNGAFNRLMDAMRRENINGTELLRRGGEEEYRTFIKLCVNYDRLDAVFSAMSEAEQGKALSILAERIGRDPFTMMEYAVAIASVPGITRHPESLRELRKAVKDGFAESARGNNAEAHRIYGLLGSLMGKTSGESEGWFSEMAAAHPVPMTKTVSPERLVDEKGIDVQRYYFYKDEDGERSFRSLLARYRGDRAWTTQDHGSFVVIRSLNAPVSVEIYANKPEDGEDGMKVLDQTMRSEGKTVRVSVLRGHSTHSADFIRELPGSSSIVILGSCGGFSEMAHIFMKVPEAAFIGTQGTGTATVNEPMCKSLAETVADGKGVDWESFWNEQERRLGANPKFRQYRPPHKNDGFTFLKMYLKDVMTSRK